MTARTCPVHGEYSASGVCRWCEPATERMPTNSPAGSTPCRCGEYAWLPGAVGERNGVIAGVAHSPEQCFKLDADPPSSPTMYETTFTLAEKTEEAYVWRLEWTEPVISENWTRHLLAQHAALRWERVARRWNWKHREPRWINEEWRAYVWRCWLEQMALRREGNLIAAGIPKEWP